MISSIKNIFITLFFILITQEIKGQSDSIKEDRFSVHFQTTVITQFKPAFDVKYTGENSLKSTKELQKSHTSTLFLGAKLWKGASIFINPEIAGGSGLSGSLGVGASTNGETYRIGEPAPQFELARLFYKQLFSLDKNTTKYIGLTIGKISVSDYFDNNKFSHDPRTQFMSWALMSNGAWDFPANTRGYSPSFVLELVTPKHELRYGFSLVPTTANGMNMNWNINKAGSHTLEYTQHYKIAEKNGSLRFVSFFTIANMGNYNQSITLNPSAPDVSSVRENGHSKYGFGINMEQYITKNLGMFLRASWNDGNNETWAFTEIDHTASVGFLLNGCKWKRKGDNIGIAYVVSGISKPHKDYLQAGGYGFMLGDGNLNYSLEHLAEIYYSAELVKNNIFISGAYQLIVNPGYNKDRGMVNVFSVRIHAKI